MNEIPAHFQLYQDSAKAWRWRLHSAENSMHIADSGDGYKSRAACINGIRLVAQMASTPYIWDVDAEQYVNQ